MGFKEPNYTQTPNELFDECMKKMGEAELRVTLAVIRKTMGYHKDKDAISWSQIVEMTGLSRTSTQDGINKAVEHGFIEIIGKGKRGVNIFRLVVLPDQSTNTTSTGSEGLPVTGSEGLPTKETEKETKKENTSPNGKASKIELDAQYDAIAEVWDTNANGWIVSIRGMIFGSTKTTGEWKRCAFLPVATIEELKAFKPYMKNRIEDMKKQGKIIESITAAVTIQRWFYDFRASRDAVHPVQPTLPTEAELKFRSFINNSDADIEKWLKEKQAQGETTT
jgi:Bacteriophage replication protein O.